MRLLDLRDEEEFGNSVSGAVTVSEQVVNGRKVLINN